MKLYYTAKAIGLYAKQTGRNITELAAQIRIGSTTLNRYCKGERMPDINILLQICNTLHLRINNFFVHPDIELTDVQIYHPDEWSDIAFRYDRIEAIRLEKGWTKTEMVENINLFGKTNITRLTYNHLITGKHFSYKTIIGLMEATGAALDSLFEQRTIPIDGDSIVISRRKLEEKDRYIASLENTIRELELKYKRLEKQSLPRYQERMENLDAEKIINTFIKQVERSLIEMKSWTMPVGHSKPRPYGEIIDYRRSMVAEPAYTYPNDEDFEEVK